MLRSDSHLNFAYIFWLSTNGLLFVEVPQRFTWGDFGVAQLCSTEKLNTYKKKLM